MWPGIVELGPWLPVPLSWSSPAAPQSLPVSLREGMTSSLSKHETPVWLAPESGFPAIPRQSLCPCLLLWKLWAHPEEVLSQRGQSAGGTLEMWEAGLLYKYARALCNINIQTQGWLVRILGSFLGVLASSLPCSPGLVTYCPCGFSLNIMHVLCWLSFPIGLSLIFLKVFSPFSSGLTAV